MDNLMGHPDENAIRELAAAYAGRRIDRRSFIREAMAVGLSASALGSVLTACQGAEGPVSTDSLSVHLDEDIGSLDPALQPGHADYMVGYNIFQNLVTFRPGTFEPVNELAEKWEGSGDGMRWDFELKKGIQFHGGFGEMTAEDVKYSFERVAGIADPELNSPYQTDWSALQEVRVTGKYTGTVILKTPFAPLMNSTVTSNSGQIVSKKAVLKLGKKFGTQPVGTGPYEFVSWQRNQQVSLRKFDKYGGAADYAPPPVWKQIDFLVIGEDNPTEIAMESGELQFGLLSTGGVDRFESNDDFNVLKRRTLDYNWIGMNVEHEKLRDKNVRLAIRYGIDIDAILQAAYDGRWERATAILPPTMPLGYWKDAPAYQRDVDKAKAYLAKAGAQGRSLDMAVSSDEPGADAVAQVVQQNLREVGLNISVLVQDPGTFGATTPEGNAQRQLFYTGFTSNPDPHWSTVWFTCDMVGTWNWMSWCNQEFSQFEEKSVRTTDEAERERICVDQQRVMDDDVSALWVAWPTLYYAADKSIKPSLRPDGRFLAWDFRPA
jgi:peptide/nickel transport system substrate-binding protein